MSQFAFWFWSDEKLLSPPGCHWFQFCCMELEFTQSYPDLWRTLVPTGPRTCVGQQRAATTNKKKEKKNFKTQWKEEEGGKSLNTETICASAPCRLIFPIPHIPQILQYNSYVWEEEKKNNKTQYFIKQIIYIDMKNWILT